MSTILTKLFGSANRIKLIRLFLLNSDSILPPKEISTRAKIKPNLMRSEINLLSNIGFIERKKKIVRILPDGYSEGDSTTKKKTKKKKLEGWGLNKGFPLLLPLKKLVLDTTPLSRVDFIKDVSKSGKIKLIILAGIFIQNEDSRVDVLVVGDKIKKNILKTILRGVEAEVGKDLNYAIFDTNDFVYRINMCDKFIRDILDYPHEKILNRLSL